MGCASSALLDQEHGFSQMASTAAFSHHIVSLTSTTYGLLSLDPPPSFLIDQHSTAPRRRITLGSLFPSSSQEPSPLETINSWELMSGLDSDRVASFRLSTPPFLSPRHFDANADYPVEMAPPEDETNCIPKLAVEQSSHSEDIIGGFEKICPPNGANKVVIYTTTLRGVRKTFEHCNAVRQAIEGVGIRICERDISMDRGFRDELRELMKGKGSSELIPPRVFVKGRYIGGVDEVVGLVEGGCLGELLRGLPQMRSGCLCEGCGGVRFLPCFTCNGSCKIPAEEIDVGAKKGREIILKCSNCNENGLVRCPICEW